MKVVQILDNIVYCELSQYGSSDEAKKYYATDIWIEDAPDYVFPGWDFDPSRTGDDRFIQTVPGEGQAYDPETGEIWIPEERRSSEREQKHSETTNDTLQALRKIREKDQSGDWEVWLQTLDDYNVAIEKTKEQPDYPLKVVYPEYPKRPF